MLLLTRRTQSLHMERSSTIYYVVLNSLRQETTNANVSQYDDRNDNKHQRYNKHEKATLTGDKIKYTGIVKMACDIETAYKCDVDL